MKATKTIKADKQARELTLTEAACAAGGATAIERSFMTSGSFFSLDNGSLSLKGPSGPPVGSGT